jgi:hypothetical protein
LANASLRGQAVKSVYFFAGDWRKGWTQFYEHPTGDNTALYTRYPADSRHLGWSEKEQYRAFALDQMLSANVNTVTMSYWGRRGDDRWEFWAPMHTSTYAHDQLFDEALSRNLVILPAIESSRCTQGLWMGWDGKPADPALPGAWQASSWSFQFASEFPWFMAGSGNANNPAPPLVVQIEDLLQRYVVAPANAGWPSRWAQIYDRNGTPRYAINLLHVASNQIGGGEHAFFAQAFDLVADKVYRDTGLQVGFTLDIIPNAHVVDQNCGSSNDDGAKWRDTFNASPELTGPLLRDTNAVLAVQAFIPEVWGANTSDEGALRAWKADFIRRWVANGPPVILDVDPGYAAFRGFDPRQGTWGWGWTDSWFNFQSELKATGIRGITFNTWNGYTEGYAGVPLAQSGGVDARGSDWLTRLYEADPQLCDHWHFVGGQATYHVYGAICDKWSALAGSSGALGAPRSSEYGISCSTGARETDFTFGAVVWTPARGAFEVNGDIYKLWNQMGGACGTAGLPLSDEYGPASQRVSNFERGSIRWTPSGGAVWLPNA